MRILVRPRRRVSLVESEHSSGTANGFGNAREEDDGHDQTFVGLEQSLAAERDFDKVAGSRARQLFVD